MSRFRYILNLKNCSSNMWIIYFRNLKEFLSVFLFKALCHFKLKLLKSLTIMKFSGCFCLTSGNANVN